MKAVRLFSCLTCLILLLAMPPCVWAAASPGVTGSVWLEGLDGGVDWVGPNGSLRGNGRNDALFQMELTAPGRTITGIELRNVDGQLSIWDTFPQTRSWLLAVNRDGTPLNRTDGSLMVPLGQGREILQIRVEDNGSISRGQTHYQLTVFFANGAKASFQVATTAPQQASTSATAGSAGSWLVSGRYSVKTFSPREFPSEWTISVQGDQVTGTSKWPCCPGARLDPIKGIVWGDSLSITRDCTGQGHRGPCSQVYTGQRVDSREVKGFFTHNGSKAGTWVMQLPATAALLAPAVSTGSSVPAPASGYLVEVTAKDIFIDQGAKKGAKVGDRFVALDNQGHKIALLQVRRVYPDVSLVSLVLGQRSSFKAGDRIGPAQVELATTSPSSPPAIKPAAPAAPAPPPATAPKPITQAATPALVTQAAVPASPKATRVGVLPAIMEARGSLIGLSSEALPAKAVAKALNVYRPLAARNVPSDQAEKIFRLEGPALEAAMDRLGLDVIIKWGVSQEEYDERVTVFVVVIRRTKVDDQNTVSIMVDADRVRRLFGRLVTRLVGESLGYI
ncbi:MAG: hypothetical protein KQI62_04410 [Deltaproteobacteria bacterium]|nr:hypothetical protein [Deltaproteobacteria bacterium]